MNLIKFNQSNCACLKNTPKTVDFNMDEWMVTFSLYLIAALFILTNAVYVIQRLNMLILKEDLCFSNRSFLQWSISSLLDWLYDIQNYMTTAWTCFWSFFLSFLFCFCNLNHASEPRDYLRIRNTQFENLNGGQIVHNQRCLWLKIRD